MDIQREREVFEAIPEIKDKITSYKMDFVNGSYDSLFSHINAWMDGAWFLFQEKAEAQAVPEGFVLVEKDLIQSIYQSCIECLDIDIPPIFRATVCTIRDEVEPLIEPQEST